MPKNTSVTLGNHFDNFIGAQLSEGRYGSASEVVRAGLRLLEESEMKLDALRAALDAGEASGIGTRSMDDIFAAARQRFEEGHD
jgi:antitoxin ParD1/3/4